MRARVVAGDVELGARFMELARQFVWEPPLGEDEFAEIRRMKARIEKERIPVGEDPEFHLKLGKGSLSDVEWTVQMLQLRHRVAGTGTTETLAELERDRAVSEPDARALRESYHFCERTRNRWHLVGALPGGASPGDSLPTQAHQLSRLGAKPPHDAGGSQGGLQARHPQSSQGDGAVVLRDRRTRHLTTRAAEGEVRPPTGHAMPGPI